MRTSRVWVRGLIGLSLGFALALSAPPASAKGKKADASAKKSEKKKIIIGAFDGPKADQARKAVIAALKDDGEYDVTESSSVKPGADDKSYAKAASDGVAAVLVGSVKKAGLTVSVHNGADGALIQNVDIQGDSAAKLGKNIDATLAVSVADAIAQSKPGGNADSEEEKPAKPAAEEEKKPEEEKPAEEKRPQEEEKPAEEAASAPPASHEEGPSPLDLQFGIRAVHRRFDYHDTPAQLFPDKGFPAPLTYLLPLGPAVFIDGTVYPLAFTTHGAAANFGITGSYEANFATKSVYDEDKPDQLDLSTHASQFFIGARGRLLVQKHEFGLVAGYGQQEFKLVGDEANPLVPDVEYKFIKLGADARFKFDDLTVGFHVGTRLVSDTGDLKRTWFHNTKTQSIELGLILGYNIAKNLDLIGGVDLLRYAFNFNPIPNTADPNSIAPGNVIAGGAVDEYMTGYLGLRYQLPNSSHD